MLSSSWCKRKRNEARDPPREEEDRSFNISNFHQPEKDRDGPENPPMDEDQTSEDSPKVEKERFDDLITYELDYPEIHAWLKDYLMPETRELKERER